MSCWLLAFFMFFPIHSARSQDCENGQEKFQKNGRFEKGKWESDSSQKKEEEDKELKKLEGDHSYGTMKTIKSSRFPADWILVSRKRSTINREFVCRVKYVGKASRGRKEKIVAGSKIPPHWIPIDVEYSNHYTKYTKMKNTVSSITHDNYFIIKYVGDSSKGTREKMLAKYTVPPGWEIKAETTKSVVIPRGKHSQIGKLKFWTIEYEGGEAHGNRSGKERKENFQYSSRKM